MRDFGFVAASTWASWDGQFDEFHVARGGADRGGKSQLDHILAQDRSSHLVYERRKDEWRWDHYPVVTEAKRNARQQSSPEERRGFGEVAS